MFMSGSVIIVGCSISPHFLISFFKSCPTNISDRSWNYDIIETVDIPTSQTSPLKVGQFVNKSWSISEKVGHSQNINLHNEIAFEDWLVTHQIILYLVLFWDEFWMTL